jgi:hypothetical protein
VTNHGWTPIRKQELHGRKKDDNPDPCNHSLTVVIAVGLFSSVIHVREASADSVCEALSDTVPRWNFRLSGQQNLAGNPQSAPREGLLYLVSPLQGYWTVILEGHFAVKNGPWLSDLAKSLSAVLATYTLALMVHDDDVLFYNLCQEGEDLDGYNSNPQYFERAKLSERAVAEQRHDPRPFEALLPRGVGLVQLREVLDRGWWSACNGGRLDADGVQPTDEPGFASEGERMIAMGNLLQLHGTGGGYPYASWASANANINWRAFQELRFESEQKG